MSGITAIYKRDRRAAPAAMLERMTRALGHRGPDGINRWLEGPVGLGQCVLYTTPESLQERYPLADASGTCWIVWDGRLDNRADLLQRLRSEPFALGAETDPDLALAAYRVWGHRCAEHLLGEFAFVVWDQRAHTLLGVRDRLGLKPFYYCQQGAMLLIASEAKALLSVMDRAPDPDGELLLAMLLAECREPDNHRSLFAGIHRLPPGHVLIATEQGVTLQRYWEIDPSHQTIYARPQAYVEHFRFLLEEAVRCRTRSAFPIGSLLSGGLDSSAVTAKAAALSAQPVEAFTIFADEPAADERPYAQQVCDAAGLKLWAARDRQADPLDGLDRLLWEVECPLVTTDHANARALAALMRSRNCRIILDGDGGDHLLDEEGYLADLLIRTSPMRFLRETRQFAQWYGTSSAVLQRMAVSFIAPQPMKYLGKRLFRGLPPQWMNPQLVNAVDVNARLRQPRVPVPCTSLAQTISYADALSPYFLLVLELVEREAAHASRELWHPLLDSRLVEFVLSIPWHQRCHDGQRKWLLREAIRGVVPEVVRTRRGKGDWTTGMDRALEALCRIAPTQLLANRSGRLEHFLDLRGVRRLLARYVQGTRNVRWDVWSCVALDHWLTQFYTEGAPHVRATLTRQEALPPADAARVR